MATTRAMCCPPLRRRGDDRRGDHATRRASPSPARPPGAMAGAFFARQCGFDNAISLDMGGTSADISLMFGGEVRVANEWSVEFGYPIMFPSIEIVTIGAGGGSVAWIDAGGSLRNGPQSMGADPGPAPTSAAARRPQTPTPMWSSAGSVRGLLGGAMPLDVAAAERAVTRRWQRHSVTTRSAPPTQSSRSPTQTWPTPFVLSPSAAATTRATSASSPSAAPVRSTPPTSHASSISRPSSFRPTRASPRRSAASSSTCGTISSAPT